MLGWNLLQTSSGNISKYVASKMSGIFKKNKDDDDKKNKGGGAGGGGSTTKIKSIQGGKISAAAPYYELEQAGMKAEQERQAQVTAQNVSYFESVINALPSEELQAMYTEMFLDTAATFGYKNLEEVFTSPSATSAVWSQLMAQGNYDGVSAIIGNQDFYKQISNSKKVNEDDILTYFLRNFVPAFNGGSFASIAVPAFARGVVIPPNQPFLGILGEGTGRGCLRGNGYGFRFCLLCLSTHSCDGCPRLWSCAPGWSGDPEPPETPASEVERLGCDVL